MSNITPEFNKYPKIANFDEVIFIAQQAYELGFRGGTGRELYSWLQTRLDLTGLSNTAGLPEDFPEPNTQLTASNKGEWTILTPGTYQKQTTGEIIVPDNQFAFAQFDGTDYNLVKFVEMPEAKAKGAIKESEENAVSGDVVYKTLNPAIKIGDLEIPFTLEAGQINPATGAINGSTNWLCTNMIKHYGGEIHIYGLGTVGAPSTGLYQNRVAIYDAGANFSHTIDGEERSGKISFDLQSGYYFRVQVEANSGVALDIPNSLFWNSIKIWVGESDVYEETYLKAESLIGNIGTPQILKIEHNLDAIKSSFSFKENIEETSLTFAQGYLTIIGSTNNVPGYYRTSIIDKYSPAAYKGEGEVLYSGRMTPIHDVATVWFLDQEMNKISYLKLAEGEYNKYNLGTPPEGTAFIATCSYEVEPEIFISETLAILKNTGNPTFYVSKNGDDSNTGAHSNPFLTISKAIKELSGTNGGQVIISSGDYRETLDFASLESGRFSLKSREGHKVRILGSDEISGFTKTEGFSNVYEADFHGTIPNWSRADNPIFEDGRPSMEIDFTERHPLHKNLKYRLPFSPIYSKNNLTEVDSTPGSYFYDTATTKIYIHTSDSINPNISDYKYEVIQRNINTYNNASTTSKSIELYIEGIQFMYHWSGVISRGFKKVHFVNCVSLASIGAGAFRPDTGLNIFEYCEAGFCNNDGFNGHFSGYSGYQSLTDNRSNYPSTHYIACWGHDNFDDGESSHEHHNVYMSNCLLEYNTKSGCMPSNDATYLIDDTVFRFNSGRNFGLSVTGYGLASVNPPSSENRIGVSVQATNCISYGNDYGYGILSSDTNKLYLSNCVSRNNLLGEFRPNKGKMTLDNCKASNPDSNKIIIQDGTGTFEILKDDIII